jgi:MraZ protein
LKRGDRGASYATPPVTTIEVAAIKAHTDDLLVFRGATNISLDAKGRLAIPTRFRDLLSVHCDGQLVITIETEERCLLIYPLPEWEEAQSKLNALPSLNPDARRLQRLLIGHADDVQLDGNGRILISQILRDYARLDRKTVLIGQAERFELWSEDNWNKRLESYLPEQPGELSEETKNFPL